MIKEPDASMQGIIVRLAVKMEGLGVKAKFLRADYGPVVTTLYYELGWETPINRILNRTEDLALAAGVESILVFRKVGEIAIEIPNKNREIIKFDNCLFQLITKTKYNIPLMLGVDSHGEAFNLDLVEQPHVLIAGSTGGGKSVLLSSIIGAIGVACSARDVRLILVDTKKLDLPLFQNMPHVLENCETAEQFQVVLNKLMNVVRSRTEKMKGIARNVTEYNQIVGDDYKQRLPYYVVCIDELADLIDDDDARSKMDETYKDTYIRIPKRIKSLVQICRAAGVHIIAATQRSSVKVISGDIKANFPTRIALRLPSRADSSTILSGNGAENLLGKGDMLIESPAFSQYKRAHGAYVSNEDICNILDNSDRIREQLLAISGASPVEIGNGS